jgi:hypothetical protein
MPWIRALESIRSPSSRSENYIYIYDLRRNFCSFTPLAAVCNRAHRVRSHPPCIEASAPSPRRYLPSCPASAAAATASSSTCAGRGGGGRRGAMSQLIGISCNKNAGKRMGSAATASSSACAGSNAAVHRQKQRLWDGATRIRESNPHAVRDRVTGPRFRLSQLRQRGGPGWSDENTGKQIGSRSQESRGCRGAGAGADGRVA